jgi:N-acetylglucosaminyldiphosphoundecaprenol N-acetyl-beta-D-mannosaminyltransferase
VLAPSGDSEVSAAQGLRLPARRYRLMGAPIDAMTRAGFLDAIGDATAARCPLLILNHNMHGLALAQRDPEFAAYFEKADLVYIDGMVVVGLARLARLPVRRADRLAVLDWIWPFFDRADRLGWKVVHLGSTEPVLERAVERIRTRAPGLRFTAIPGFFDQRPGSEGNEQMLSRLRAERPDVLLVGLGMPRQELWLSANQAQLPRCVVITVGGIIGFIGGDRPTAPRWMGSLGIEWVFRLATEPRRLWHRYLVEPVVLIRPMLRQVLGRDRRKPRGRHPG